MRLINSLPIICAFALQTAPALATVSQGDTMSAPVTYSVLILARNGADDAAGHDAGDDRGRGGHGRDGRNVDSAQSKIVVARRGEDDPVGHDAGDDRGGHGADDPVGHDVGDDRGLGGHGADDPADHDLNDDRGLGGHGADDPADHDLNDDRGGDRS